MKLVIHIMRGEELVEELSQQEFHEMLRDKDLPTLDLINKFNGIIGDVAKPVVVKETLMEQLLRENAWNSSEHH